ncbi:prephenate dehydratase domain-containing protein [Streptomyces tremellae]|uniref:Prephenate dehydratase domain-containing protein n=1 Tax=Streptomyces tremellae TaxID=1124239 RepID=A0ABP7GFD8_9ACTN
MPDTLQQHWIGPDAEKGTVASIATLGPRGTSSEQAALYLWADRGTSGPATIELYDTYERAGAAVFDGTATHLLVANAYAHVNTFYMSPRLRLAGAFVFDTPQYGIAVSPGHAVGSRPRIASHPAPVPLIEELIPEEYRAAELVLTDSTSAAAAKAQALDTDLALTTEPAAKANHLQFISRTRPIRMLWSVFQLGTSD